MTPIEQAAKALRLAAQLLPATALPDVHAQIAAALTRLESPSGGELVEWLHKVAEIKWRPWGYESDQYKYSDSFREKFHAAAYQLAALEADNKRSRERIESLHVQVESFAAENIRATREVERLREALRNLLMVSLPSDVSGRVFIDEARAVLAAGGGA